MKTYQIWSEGYLCSGMDGIPSGANRHGEMEGTSFEDAVRKLADKDPNFNEYLSKDMKSHWGCKLFDNHSDASESFG